MPCSCESWGYLVGEGDPECGFVRFGGQADGEGAAVGGAGREREGECVVGD